MRGLLFLALTITGLIFFLQNRQPVTLFFLGTNQQSALVNLTLPLGLWVVIFTSVGILTSVIINGLSRIGQPLRWSAGQSGRSFPQRPIAEPPPPSPPPSPRYQAPEPEPEPVASESEWDWDDPIPEVADWDVKQAPSPPKPDIKTSRSAPLRDRPPTRSSPPPRADVSEPIAAPRPDFVAPEPAPVEPEIKPEPDPQRREPLPDLRQFEAPQTLPETKRQGTIYSQQYRPARSPTAKASSSEDARLPSKPVYDAPYRVINPASNPPSSNPDQSDGLDDDEDWI